jgi:hypothetical protein
MGPSAEWLTAAELSHARSFSSAAGRGPNSHELYTRPMLARAQRRGQGRPGYGGEA